MSHGRAAADGSATTDGYGKSKGQRTRMVEPGDSGSTAYYYQDVRGRLSKQSKIIDGQGPYETQWQYNAMDRVVTMTYPSSEAVAVEYNPQGLPQTLAGADPYVTGASYTAQGQTDLLQLGEAGLDLQVKYDYYTDGQRLQRLRVGTASVPGRDLDMRYTYDDVGNVTQIDDVRNGQTQYQIFGYDALDRLTSAATSGAGTWGSYSESYTYNAIGNMTSKDGVSYIYPASGPSSVRPHAVTSTSNGGTFSYDTNGNMTSRRDKTGDPTYSQVWDYENRLVSVTANGQTTTFTYDGDGALVKKVVGGVTTVYVGNHYEQVVNGGETVIGELGQIYEALTDTPQTVVLSRSYTHPVVFAQPLSRNGGDSSLVRITDVQPDRFTLYVDEAPNHDGAHTAETVSWLVLEAGAWTLPGGGQLEVGRVTTAATVGKQITNQWQPLSFAVPFPVTPVVVSQVQTNNDPHWVGTRQNAVTTAGFQVALEEEEASTTAHGSEVVGWLAIEPGQGSWSGHAYEAAQMGSVTQNWAARSFGQSFGAAPRFVASLASYAGADSAHLRYQALTSLGVQVMVEEEKTWDTEMNHTGEAVHYLAIEGDGTLTAEGSASGGTLYYYFGGQRVAMRKDGMVYWLVGDHLGTTSLVLDAEGNKVAESRHLPYGEERWTSGTLPTDYRFTGQRDTGLGLYHMGARFYDAYLPLVTRTRP